MNPVVGVIMGSESDFETMREAVRVLDRFAIAHECEVVSAHRTPERMFDHARAAAGRGLKVLIAGAGGAAHLPGMVSALTSLPVLGVPVQSRALNGLDSLLSIVQMPAGVLTATFATSAGRRHQRGAVRRAMLALGDQQPGRRAGALLHGRACGAGVLASSAWPQAPKTEE